MNDPDLQWPYAASHLNEECEDLEERLRREGWDTPQAQWDMFDMMLRQLRSEVPKRKRRMTLRAITQREAKLFVAQHHSTHGDRLPHGWKFGMGVQDHLGLLGVAMVGRPEARALQDGETLEVTRLCTLKGADNACSMLLANAARAAKAMGYKRLYTYTSAEQDGASHKAAGFEEDASVWSRRDNEQKTRWIRRLA